MIQRYLIASFISTQVVSKCLELGAQRALFISADMASPSDAESVVQYAIEQLGGLDYLVLNHIGPSPYRMWDGDVEHTRWLLEVYNLCKHFVLAKVTLFVPPKINVDQKGHTVKAV